MSATVRFELPNTAEAEIEVIKDQRGNVVAIEVTPQFTRAGSTPTVLYAQVLEEEEAVVSSPDTPPKRKVVRKGIVQLSGQHGVLQFRDRSKSVLPQFLGGKLGEKGAKTP